MLQATSWIGAGIERRDEHLNLYGTLRGSNSSVPVQGGDVAATSIQLLFNFGGTDDACLLLHRGAGIYDGFHHYCDATLSGICLTGETVEPAYTGTKRQAAPPTLL
jgi:hypothetical protein